MKIVLAFVLSLAMVACTSSKPEDKIADVLEKTFSSEELQKKIDPDLTKIMGAEDTKFKKSVRELFLNSTKISWSDIKVEGNKATAKVAGTTINGEEFAGLFLMAALVGGKAIKDMTVEQFVNELAKGKGNKGGRKTASIKDMKIDNYEATIPFELNGEDWKIDEKSVKNLFDKKNKVKAAKK